MTLLKSMDELGHSRNDPYPTNSENFCHSRQGGKETYLKKVLIIVGFFGERGCYFQFSPGEGFGSFLE